ncbi:hypothetical protein JHU04_004469 [Brenneria sp. 4F2]|nr:hypothetical protein [Brenneria bubanii]
MIAERIDGQKILSDYDASGYRAQVDGLRERQALVNGGGSEPHHLERCYRYGVLLIKDAIR